MQAEHGKMLQELLDRIVSHDRYRNGEVRFGLPTTKGGERRDVGIQISASLGDAALAVLAIVAVAEDVERYVEEQNDQLGEGWIEEIRGSVQGDIEVEEDGAVQATVWLSSLDSAQVIIRSAANDPI